MKVFFFNLKLHHTFAPKEPHFTLKQKCKVKLLYKNSFVENVWLEHLVFFLPIAFTLNQLNSFNDILQSV